MYKLFVLYDNKNVKEHIVSIVRKTELPLNTEYIDTADLYKNLTDKPDIAIVSCNKDSNTLSIARQLSEKYPCVPLILTYYAVYHDVALPANVKAIIPTQNNAKPLTEMLRQLCTSVLQTEDFMSKFNEPINPDIETSSGSSRSRTIKRAASNEKCLFSTVAVVDSDTVQSQLRIEHLEKMDAAVRKYISTIKNSDIEFHQLTKNEKTVLLMQSNYMLTRKYLTEIFTPLISSLHTSLNDKFTVGFSPLNSLTRNYKVMHDLAVESLDFRRVSGGNKLIFHQDIADDKNWVVPFDNTAYKQLISALRNSTCAEMHKLLSNLLESASKKRYYPCCHYVKFNLFIAILNACESPDILSNNYLPQNKLFTHFVRIKTKEETHAFIRNVANEVFKANQQLKLNSVHKNYFSIIQFIEHNYTDSTLDMQKLSANLGLSVSYISSLLKKHETSFVKYLTDLGIEQAKLMLRDNGRLIADISESVGYSDPYYFSHCFKKATGMSPRAFRQYNIRSELNEQY